MSSDPGDRAHTSGVFVNRPPTNSNCPTGPINMRRQTDEMLSILLRCRFTRQVPAAVLFCLLLQIPVAAFSRTLVCSSALDRGELPGGMLSDLVNPQSARTPPSSPCSSQEFPLKGWRPQWVATAFHGPACRWFPLSLLLGITGVRE